MFPCKSITNLPHKMQYLGQPSIVNLQKLSIVKLLKYGIKVYMKLSHG